VNYTVIVINLSVYSIQHRSRRSTDVYKAYMFRDLPAKWLALFFTRWYLKRGKKAQHLRNSLPSGLIVNCF